MVLQIENDYTKLNKSDWKSLLRTNENFSYFQSPEIYQVYQLTDYCEPIVIACIAKGEFVGVLLANIQKEYNGILGTLTSRSIIWGGPIVKNNNPEYIIALFDEYEKIIKGKAIYSQIRSLGDTSNYKSIIETYGFKYEEHLDILIDLNKPEEKLWSELHSKRRNEIRRANNSGLEFSIDNSIDGLHGSYSVLLEVYKRAKLPLPKIELFINLMRLSSDNSGLKNFTAKSNNKIIGCMLALVYNNVIYDFYAGSYQEYYKYYPNDLIPWKIFLWGKINGYSKFDFGGAGKPNVPYGVRNYKLKFGGELVNFGRLEKVHNPFLFKIGKLGLKLWKLLK